jgi:hypothetical protein
VAQTWLGVARANAYALVAASALVAAIAFQATQEYPTGLFDLYPLYYGAKAWLATGSAYRLEAVAPQPPAGVESLLGLGNAYPFPAVLLVLPLAALEPRTAGLVWTGLLMLSLVIAVRFVKGATWLLLYLPLLEAVRIEQYSALIVAMQLGALAALQRKRYWALGVLLSLILTKPNQGLLFVAVMLLLGRSWPHFGAAMVGIWGGSLLLSPGWPADWLPIAINNVTAVERPVYWPFAVLLIPLLVARDWVSLSVAAPVLLGQFRDVYVAAGLPIGVVDVPRSMWLAPLGATWLIVSAVIDPGWGTALTLVLPVVVLSVYRRWRARGSTRL